ncbi:hypothetical protein T265_12453 [Opisthorchis viverrini]|uniref:Uncharacterized protein n=2 Tax=Opisthorchis viverrini TaxID=6198 RepID=A0A075ADI9_OPIVI|nr:hypothetical protein T265_12453 [Opisthorchis viverrini]KER34240.1 hypothetical protein T265_12453 [Opisthorchis viverrini]
MFRRFISLRCTGSNDTFHRLGLLYRLRKHSVLLACISSGLLYRGYVALPQPQFIQICQNPHRYKVQLSEYFALYSFDGTSGSDPKENIRVERMLILRQKLEEELPSLFEKGLLHIPSSFLDPTTVVSFERSNGKVHTLSTRSSILAALALVRVYYLTRSYVRWIEIVNLLSDSEKFELEVSFRIVLLPLPSLSESRLPPEQLLQKLESRAKWHEYRATFIVAENGEVSEVRLTKFLPPDRSPQALKNLRRLSVLKRLAPALPSTRKLPSLNPFFLSDVHNLRDSVSLLHSPYSQHNSLEHTVRQDGLFTALMNIPSSKEIDSTFMTHSLPTSTDLFLHKVDSSQCNTLVTAFFDRDSGIFGLYDIGQFPSWFILGAPLFSDRLSTLIRIASLVQNTPDSHDQCISKSGDISVTDRVHCILNNSLRNTDSSASVSRMFRDVPHPYFLCL